MSVLLASAVYLVAHLSRALRFWLLLGDTHVSISRTVRRFYLLSVTGLFVPSVLMEPCKIAALLGLCRSRIQTVLAYFVYRTMDLLGIGVLLLAACSFSTNARAWTFQGFPWLFYLGMCALGSLFLVGLTSARLALLPLQNYLLRRHHYLLGTKALRFLCGCARSSEQIAGGSDRLLVAPLLLTVLAWTLDIIALSVLLPGARFSELAPSWLGVSVNTLLSFSAPARNHRASAGYLMFLPQIIPALLVVALSFGRRTEVSSGPRWWSGLRASLARRRWAAAS